jgi:hypothetical protein
MDFEILPLALLPSSVIITFYDLIFVISTLPGKREYFEIHLHKKCTKLTPEDLKAIVLMSLVTLKKNSIRSSRRLSVFASFQKESSYGHDLHWKL